MSGSDGGGNDRDQGYGIDANSFNPYPLNAALPAGARWVTAPTLQNLQADRWPSIESIDPSLYASDFNGGSGSPYVTDPKSGGRISVVPWQVNPAYAGNPLVVSPAIPLAGGTENLQAGTFTDPNDSGGIGTDFNYDLGTGYATPTQQSLQIQLQNVLDNRMGPGLSLLTEAPFMATAALAVPAIGAMLAPLAGGAAATTAGSGLLGDVLGAAQQVTPYVNAAQDVMKASSLVSNLLNPPRPQVSQPSLLR